MLEKATPMRRPNSTPARWSHSSSRTPRKPGNSAHLCRRRDQRSLLSRRGQFVLLRACSFRLENDAVACASVGTLLGRSATSSGPCSPPSESLRSRRQLPTEANMNMIQPQPRPASTGRMSVTTVNASRQKRDSTRPRWRQYKECAQFA